MATVRASVVCRVHDAGDWELAEGGDTCVSSYPSLSCLQWKDICWELDEVFHMLMIDLRIRCIRSV
jgi:hypothetical protein